MDQQVVFSNAVLTNRDDLVTSTIHASTHVSFFTENHGKPMVFGKERNMGIRMNGAHPEVVTIGENGITENDLLVHDIYLKDRSVAFMLERMEQPDLPTAGRNLPRC